MELARVSQECFMKEVTFEILNPEFQILALHFLTVRLHQTILASSASLTWASY